MEKRKLFEICYFIATISTFLSIGSLVGILGMEFFFEDAVSSPMYIILLLLLLCAGVVSILGGIIAFVDRMSDLVKRF